MDFIKKVILFIEEAMQVHSSGSKSQRRDCSGMKRVGILANVDESKGGVYQYTHSLIYALSSDSSNKYIVFSKHGDKNFDSYGLEVRNFIKPNNFYSRSFFMLLMLLLECRNSFFMSKEEKEIFSDIDLFISPISNPYPHFYLDREFIF
ncbi:MAG: hypothetical protein OEL87_03945, partial [Nanoarchaeota archaeon]|nr:hypothetical protein [Nanoarchaeota archaeon]